MGGVGAFPRTILFAYQEGEQLIEFVERMRQYLVDTLAPQFNTSFDALIAAFEAEVNAVNTAVNAALAEQGAAVDSALAAQVSAVNLAMANQLADVVNQLSANVTYVNGSAADARAYVDAAVLSIINSTIAVTDPVMVAVDANATSAFRVQQDARNGGKFATIDQSEISTILRVSPTGLNSNTGRSWKTAKATVGGALSTLAGVAGTILVSPGTITETVSWGVVPANVTILGSGINTTLIKHGFSGDLATLSGGVQIQDLTIDGQGATFTGACFTLTGTEGNQLITNVRVKLFDGFCFDFAVGAGSGFKSVNLEAYRSNAASGTGRYAINISDTQQLSAVPRSFVNLSTAGQCAINFGGCNDTFIVSSFIADLRFTSESRAVNISASRIANQSALTVSGHNNSIVGCDVNPQITVSPGTDATTIGPGSFNNLPIIDNSGNVRNLFNHWAIAYTPTLGSGGVAPVLGNGSLIGSYSREGSTITYNIEFTIGTTTTLGTGGFTFGLPQSRANGAITEAGVALISAGGTFTAVARIPGALPYLELLRDTTGSVTYNSPATFAAGHVIRIAGSYMI